MTNQVPQIKRCLLRLLLAAGTQPMPDEALIDAVTHSLVPRPLRSHVLRGRDELESGGFLVGTLDPIEETKVWTLTVAGKLQAEAH